MRAQPVQHNRRLWFDLGGSALGESAAQTASDTAATLRVRTVGRFDAATALGGGEVQLAATTAALRELGHDARPWRPWEDQLAAGDVVHYFGSRPEFLPLIDQAHRQGAKCAVSTIAWFDWRNAWREPGSLAGRCLAAGRYAARAAFPRTPSWRRGLYHAADLLLPNSQSEAEQLMRLFEISPQKIHVVPNGADPRFGAARPELFHRRFGVHDFVLSVGRLEPRKNQLALVRAVRDLKRPLVQIGSAVAGHEDYAEHCRREAGPAALFLDRLEHDDPLLASAYAACACAALVGWYETPGLAAIEAAMTGAPLVLPEGGCGREYFGPRAEYVAAGDVVGIRRAVERAASRGRDPAWGRLICEQFSWRRGAEVTADAYATLR